MLWLRRCSSKSCITSLFLIHASLLLLGLYRLHQQAPPEHPPNPTLIKTSRSRAMIQKQANQTSVSQVQKETEISEHRQTQQATSKVHVDFQDLLTKIKAASGRNLRVRISRNKQSQRRRVTLEYTDLVFPKTIDISKTRVISNPSKKYVYVHTLYNDQLSKNTRAFLSLCAQAGISGRKVVQPFVRQTKLGSDDSWHSLETYYDVKYLKSLLAAANYASLVDKSEYLRECPPDSTDHVSIHFLDDSTASMGYTKANFKMTAALYQAILRNTTHTGWTECGFLDKALKRAPGKQFCVHANSMRSWKAFENRIVKNAKCLNFYGWRGIDGVSYRLKFSEDKMKYSSVDVTFALRPGRPVMNEVQRFAQDALSDKYIGIYVRSEFMLRGDSLGYLQSCVDLILEVLVALKTITGLSNVYVATDMGDYGSSWLAGFRMKKHLDEDIFKRIHERIIQESNGVAYTPRSETQDRGTTALVDMTLMARAQYLISAGTGTFQQWIAARFLANHVGDKQPWSKITVCT